MTLQTHFQKGKLNSTLRLGKNAMILSYGTVLQFTIFLKSGFKSIPDGGVLSPELKTRLINCLKNDLAAKAEAIHVNHCELIFEDTLIASFSLRDDDGSIMFEFKDTLLLHIEYRGHVFNHSLKT